MTIRAVYERRKEDFLNTQSKIDEEETDNSPEIEAAKKKETKDKIIAHQDTLHLNSRGELDVWSVKETLSQIGENSGRHTAYYWKKILEREHPELTKNIKLRDKPPVSHPEDESLV